MFVRLFWEKDWEENEHECSQKGVPLATLSLSDPVCYNFETSCYVRPQFFLKTNLKIISSDTTITGWSYVFVHADERSECPVKKSTKIQIEDGELSQG